MRSGLDFSEGRYTLNEDAIRYGLRRNMKRNFRKIKTAEPPGRFRYQSANTQLLGWVLKQATGKSLSAYLEEKLWKPLGAEHDATWNVDSKSNKMELASAGLNAIPRDFAKLGQLYINKGKWNGKQIIDEEWVHTISSADTMNKYNGYKNQWWSRTNNRTGAFSAIGFLNQYLYINPRNNVVIVRIGRRWANSYGVSARFIYGLGESL
jgi:CubicO group peptidase (beta-lactamase class C family)